MPSFPASSLLCALLPVALGLTACSEKSGSETGPGTAKGPIKLGVLPAADAAAVEAAYQPLVEAIGKTLNRPVELVVPSSYDDLLAKLRGGDLQLAQLSAAAFVRARGVMTGQVLVQQSMDFATESRGAFVVKKGAFAGLKALKGKRFAYVDEHSSAGYWFPRMKLRQNNFDPDTVFGEVSFAGSHQKVVERVRAGEVEAGAVSEQTISGADDLEAIEITNAIPDDVIVAVGGLTQQEQESIRALLLGATGNAALAGYLKSRTIRAFKPHNFDEYALLEMELRISGALLGNTPPAKK